MNFVLKSISYVFHPLLMPLLGVLFYFHKTPRFIPEPLQHAKLFSISLLTIILPLLVYYLLKTIKKVNSINLQTTEERKHTGGMLDQGLGIAEANGAPDQTQAVHHCNAGRIAAFQLECDHAAKSVHLALCQLVLRETRESGIENRPDRSMF